MVAGRGFVLYASAAVVGLLGLGHPGPAQASVMVEAGAGQPTTTTATTTARTTTKTNTATQYANGAPSAAGSPLSSGAPPPGTCPSKTINYMTHTLPQQCLRTAWSSANATASAADEAGSPIVSTTTMTTTTMTHALHAPTPTPTRSDHDDDGQDSAGSAFISFEEWKVLQLQKAGQDPADLQARRRQHRRGGGGGGSQADIDSLGDDGEISLDFDVLNERVSEMAGSAAAEAPGGRSSSRSSSSSSGDDGEAAASAAAAAQNYRSKDAGRTSKERFSFASFDAGATVLKTSSGATNAKAILVENKDSYMLLACNAPDKSVVVELSDDILVDTVVLANYEFFSSMVRQFRVSVSDRYPAKADRWRTLGTYEARNLRGIQPFLIANPQIWARYLRIDFLSHYGNEYYCPISLLRVHGTRMLDSWKESENGHDEDDEDGVDGVGGVDGGETAGFVAGGQPAEAAAASPPPAEAAVTAQDVPKEDTPTSAPPGCTLWRPVDDYGRLFAAPTCAKPSATDTTTAASAPASADQARGAEPLLPATATPPTAAAPPPAPSDDSAASPATVPPHASSAHAAPGGGSTPAAPDTSSAPPAAAAAAAAAGVDQADHAAQLAASAAAAAAAAASSGPGGSTGTGTGAGTGTGSATPPQSPPQSPPPPPPPPPPPAGGLPTVQESFFKSVTKRLQLLESNATLSLQYIAEQSRFLQEALRKTERKQTVRVDTFLHTLNTTVLSELRQMRQQYDQLWQSTVLALEAQREQSQRETVALSDRLNVLADEVVFQKRMAIVQSVLLLCCLALVLFSRALSNLPGVAGVALSNSRLADGLASPASPPSPTSPASPPSPPYYGLGRTLRGPGLYAAGYRSSARAVSSPARPMPNTNKVLPLTPTTPTSPVSLSPLSRSPSSSPSPSPPPPLTGDARDPRHTSPLVAPLPPPPQILLGQAGDSGESECTGPRNDAEAGLFSPSTAASLVAS